MEAIFKKLNGNGFYPICENSLAMFDKVPDGALVKVEYIKKRNYENHKRFFKFLEAAFDNQEFYDNTEQFRKAIQMIGGHYESLSILDTEGNATTHFIPKSIAFDKMDEEEFKNLFNKCITGFLGRYGNGIKESELMRIIDFD